MKRINIFVGNYGSGKTEISLNTALKLNKLGKRVILADIDIVKPYFRSSEHKDMLEQKGIMVMMPPGANTNVDLPSLPVDIYSAFDGDQCVVIDCGGDPAGATALGSLRHKIQANEKDVSIYFVLNARRPLQASANETIEMLTSIEYVSKLKVGGIINNTNLANETTVEDLIFGNEIAKQVSEKTGIKISYVSGTGEIIDEFLSRYPEFDGKAIKLELLMRPYWQQT